MVNNDALDRLIEGNQRASDLHREATNKVHYNKAVDDCIMVLMNHQTNNGENNWLIKKLSELKKEQP